ncbi:hypothetical protein EDD15DRAFT_2377076 [Pisolithus albus]|nr:hypothetical protein EDD15DRAFT_2377076 [Pisolithus albus]
MGSKANESASHRRLWSTWPLAGQPIIGDTPAGPQQSITSFHSLGQGVPFFPFDMDPSSMTLRMFIKTQDLAHTGVARLARYRLRLGVGDIAELRQHYSNYLDFLQAILRKHGLQSYEVTEKKRFPLKYVPPKAKGQRVSDVIDVDNAADYREMVKKISEEKPAIVKIFVDMRHIEKLPHPSKSSEDNSEFTSDSEKGKSGHVKKVDLDNRLARCPLGSIPLTPAMVCDWCLALEDGQATIATPPNIESFSIANKAPILHPMRKAAVQAAQPPSPAAADLNSLTLAILLEMLAQFDSGLHAPTSPASPTPQTPARN